MSELVSVGAIHETLSLVGAYLGDPDWVGGAAEPFTTVAMAERLTPDAWKRIHAFLIRHVCDTGAPPLPLMAARLARRINPETSALPKDRA